MGAQPVTIGPADNGGWMAVQTTSQAPRSSFAMKALRAVRRTVFPFSASRLPLWRSVVLAPPLFAGWYYLCRAVWYVQGYRLKHLDPASKVSSFVRNETTDHNLGNRWIINRDRTERLIQLLRQSRSFKPNSRLLVVGPRNEAELLLLRAYGFNSHSIEAIDLFSASPWVKLMDMHDLKYPDNSFDIVYSSFVITYSDDIPRAVTETIRVARNGALAAFAFQHMAEGGGNKFGLNRLSGGTRELLDLFGPSVDKVLWSEDHVNPDGSSICSVIFRLNKPAGGAVGT